MEIRDIHSIELDRSSPFRHCIRVKDKAENTLQEIPVSEVAGYEKLMVVVNAWQNHKDYKGI